MTMPSFGRWWWSSCASKATPWKRRQTGSPPSAEAYRPPPGYYRGVLLDLILPHVSGVAVLDHLRTALGGYVPVVAMSASALALEVATTAGAVATAAKPFDLLDLLTIIEQYCAPPPPRD